MFPWNISSCVPSNMALHHRRLWPPLSLPLQPWMFYKIHFILLEATSRGKSQAGKCLQWQAMKVQMGSTDIALLILNSGTKWEWVVHTIPGCFTPPGKSPSSHCTWGWMVWRRENLLVLPGFGPCTVHSFASCCSNYTVLAPASTFIIKQWLVLSVQKSGWMNIRLWHSSSYG